jgi:hypothetical protein
VPDNVTQRSAQPLRHLPSPDANERTILQADDIPSDVALTRRPRAEARILDRLVVVGDGDEALDYLQRSVKYAGRDSSHSPPVTLLDNRPQCIEQLGFYRLVFNEPLPQPGPV